MVNTLTSLTFDKNLLRVDRSMNRFLIFVCLLASTFSSMAETALTASVDRNKIYESDTINLIITGDIEMDFSFGGLMNFGRQQIDPPVIEGLDQNFEILDQKQSYNMQSINGETKAKVTWSYSLAPKQIGTLTIPPAKYKDAQSNPVTISVLRGKAPQDANNPPQVFIEAVVDKPEAYVQEQIIYTLRLYSADRLASGELSVPESNDAIIEALGDTKKYFRMAYNRRYEVRERQYLLFPQKSGELTIEAQSFNGLLIDTRNRRRLRVRESTDPISIDIKPPPPNFSGDIWLPATSFHLSEKWETPPDNLLVGDSITRTLEINSLGLLGSALPPMGIEKIQGLKIYPDSPTVESLQHESGAQSIRQESIALVAVAPNEITLPEIRIPWWDTVNDIERVAVIPAQSLSIKVNPETEALVQTPPTASAQTPMQAATPKFENPTTELPVNSVLPSTSNQAWYTIIVLLVLGWISTTWWLLKRQPISKLTDAQFSPEPDLTQLYKTLCEAINTNDSDMPKYLIQWANKVAQSKRIALKILNIHNLKDLDEGLYLQAKAFEHKLYASAHTPSESKYDKTLLLQHVKRVITEKDSTSKSSPLQPMFP